MLRRCWAVTTALAVSLFASSSALAQSAPRAWVSGHGTDTPGCGAPTAPCRSLQYAHDNIVEAGGEIDILDPAGYGAVTITKALSIVNDGAGTAGLQATSGERGVLIDAGPSDAVTLRGLDIEGVGSGLDGVQLTVGGALTIEDCTIDGFTFAGVVFSPSSGANLFVSNTRVANIGGIGVDIVPSIPSGSAQVHATLERLEAVNDSQAGVLVDGSSSGSGVTLHVTVADSLLDNNTTDGVHAFSVAGDAPTFVIVRNTTLSNNAWGASVQDATSLYLARSTLSGNSVAAFFRAGTGVLGSYGDNDVVGNGAVGPTPTSVPLH